MTTVELEFTRSTKNTHLYTTTNPGPITTLYVGKSAFPIPPKKIKVAVEAVEE